MPSAPTAAIDRLAAGVTVVTATRRLARELRRQFDERQAAAGRHAWESADVLPYHAFLARVWQRLGGDASGGELRINEWQLAATWETVIADDIRVHERDVQPLWNTHASARRAVDAWRIVCDWRIDLAAVANAAEKSKHRDHQCWLRWARAFEQKCAARGWIDPYRLAGRLCERLARRDAAGALPARIAFSGFDRLTRQQAALVEALRAAGVAVEVDGAIGTAAAGSAATAAESAAADSAAHPTSIVFPDESAQWLGAARWARDQLADDPRASIAIVAPDIAAAAGRIESALRQILCPRRQLDPAASAPPPYHISLGAPLERHPVARDALNALAAFGGRALPAEAVSRLILSPFIADFAREAEARCRLEAACRRRLPHQIRFARLAAALTDARALGKDGAAAAAACPRLAAAVTDALALLESPAEDAPSTRAAAAASHWARRFDDFLGALGWPGEGALDSAEFQAANALRRELHNLATLDLAMPKMRAAAALAWLRRRAGEQAFQVEARGAPVQVLGVFEAAGQHFDALWFGDLSESEWPPPARPNPFIDLKLQQAAGVAAASTELNRAQAEIAHRRLLRSADTVILSRPLAVDEVEAEASVLFDGPGAVAAIAADDAAADTPARLIGAAAPALESLADSRAPALKDGATAGGVAVIENQAKCPFRAFALHRLQAREAEANEQGLDAGQRGELLHRALQLVWQTIQSSAKLRALGDDEQRELIDTAVEQAARRYTVSSGCGARFARVQARWAADTVRDWLQAERARDGFTVEALEAETEVAVGGLRLACKIDRIDRLDGGGFALIDYKTGAAETLRNWAGARPQAPQLPLYAIAQDGDSVAAVAAVAFGQVKRGACKFSGVARGDGDGDGEDFAPGVTVVAASRSLKGEFADWEALVAHWRRKLPALAAEFIAGDARVEPFQPAVCARCNLHTLCRIEADSGARS